MILVLAIALSLDTFTAGLSYSAGKVQIPLLSMIIIALVSGMTFTLSLTAGNLILFLLPLTVTRLLSFLILLSLAAYKLYDALSVHSEAASSFTTSSISRKINKKDVHILSTGEAALLSLALSIDSISAGLSAGFKAPHPAVSFLITAAVHFVAIACGYGAGRLIAGKFSCNFALLSAILLVFLAFFRLL